MARCSLSAVRNAVRRAPPPVFNCSYARHRLSGLSWSGGAHGPSRSGKSPGLIPREGISRSWTSLTTRLPLFPDWTALLEESLENPETTARPRSLGPLDPRLATALSQSPLRIAVRPPRRCQNPGGSAATRPRHHNPTLITLCHPPLAVPESTSTRIRPAKPANVGIAGYRTHLV